MQFLGVNEPVEKYYNLNKFKFSHSQKEKSEDDEEDKNKPVNKLSFC